MNKPYGVLSQFTEGTAEPGAATLAGFGLPPGVYPAGRLDRDSEGLLLLSDDGRLIHRLLNPKHGHSRTYWVQVEGVVGEDALSRLTAGVTIRGHVARAVAASRLDPLPALPDRVPPIRARKTVPDDWMEIVLTEGRNRQVRRMTAAVGLPCLRLVRVAVGALRLGDLAPGAWRFVEAGALGPGFAAGSDAARADAAGSRARPPSSRLRRT
jgi:23S rRNA pseudouridine2457 synthase